MRMTSKALIMAAALLSPLAGASAATAQDVQTVRCETGSGFYIWRVDWVNSIITERMSGIVLNFLDIESTSSTAGYIQAATDPDDTGNYIELDLYFTEASQPDGTIRTTLTRQNVFHARGWGSAARSNRYRGACRPYYG